VLSIAVVQVQDAEAERQDGRADDRAVPRAKGLDTSDPGQILHADTHQLDLAKRAFADDTIDDLEP